MNRATFYVHFKDVFDMFDQVKLEEGASYQLCWDTFSSAVAPSDWTAYYAENPPAKADAGDGSTDPGDAIDPPTDNNIAHGIDLSAMASLMNGIAASYEGTTEAWKVMDMAGDGTPGGRLRRARSFRLDLRA